MNIVHLNGLVSKRCRTTAGEELSRDTLKPPLQISGVYDLDGKPEDVFSLIADKDEISKWLPLYSKLLIGHKIAETNEVTNRPLAYSYQVRNILIPVKNHQVTIAAEPNGRGGTLLTWNQYFKSNSTITNRLSIGLFSKVLQQAIDQLKVKFGGPGGYVLRPQSTI